MKFTETHEWVKIENEIATVGISDYAQKELGDIVFVELPKVGHTLQAGDEAVVLESTKAAADVYSPISGEIIAVNTSLLELPEKVNLQAQSEGWLFKVKATDSSEMEPLMDKLAYEAFVKS